MKQQLDIYMSDTTAEPKALHLAEVYAHALIDSLPDISAAGEIADELREIQKIIDDIPGAQQLLTSPVISATHKISIAQKIGNSVSDPVAGLLFILAKNHRFELISHIAKACDKVALKKAGKIELIARTAVAMNNETLENLQQQLTEALGGQCELENIVDDQIVGGLVLQKGDTVFDASLAGGLGRIANAIEQKNSLKDSLKNSQKDNNNS